MPTFLKYSGFCFSRNPIVLNLESPWWLDLYDNPNNTKGTPYIVSIGGKEVHEGRFYPPCKVDISDAVDANIKYFDEPSDTSSPVCNILDNGSWDGYTVNVHIGENGIEDDVEFIAVPGGVSRQNLRIYQKHNTDPFLARFLRTNGNFFLTSRTAGWRIVIKETELAPLYFITNTDTDAMAVRNHTTGSTISFGVVTGGVNTLNIDALRRKFFNELGELPSIFDILNDGRVACQIVIRQALPAKDRMRLKFRNAFGVYDIIDILGVVTMSPDADNDEEEDIYSLYDAAIGGFAHMRLPEERTNILSIDTLVAGRDDLDFLLSAVYSDEVYLLDYPGLPRRVLPSIGTLNSPQPMDKPQKVNISLQFADSELMSMPDINDADESVKPRIFWDTCKFLCLKIS